MSCTTRFFTILELAEKKSTILEDLNLSLQLLANLNPPIPNYYLATLHRAENTDDPKRLKSILKALREIGKDVPVILPLHPRTKKMIEAASSSQGNKGN